MAEFVAKLTSELVPDPWRQANPFAADFQSWHDRMIQANSDADVSDALNDWLQKYQPCLFGRLAAKSSGITYCVIRDEELNGTDEAILQKIQERRLTWSRAAFNGRSSAFVLIVVSPRIATATPDTKVAALSQRLAVLYLRREIEFDQIYTDEIALQFPGEQSLTRIWPTGVNYFCAQGDGRWWRDHRIPGGLAFSVNSVGHLVKSGRLQAALEMLGDDVGVGPMPQGYRIDTLDKALEFAMRTISLASDTPSGKATELLPIPNDRSTLPVSECPIPLPAFLRDKNFCEYIGRYHTDITLPSEYFLTNVDRPQSLSEHLLDFTYLFHRNIENPDFDALGDGRRIREPGSEANASAGKEDKRTRGQERIVKIENTELLRHALHGDRR